MFLLANTISAEKQVIGKTHFIVGKPEIVTAPIQPIVPVVNGNPAGSTIFQVLFAPDDNIRRHLTQLINQERQAVYIAVFMITDSEVANALCAARKRGIRVEIITDAGCLKDRASKVPQLCKNGCLVYIYNPIASAKGVSLMHHKFALFSNNEQGSCTWTGSYNFTRAANNSNRENVIIVADKQIFEKFLTQFQNIKQKSYVYTCERISAS
jgi:phosphatidylserine/phosphatidylglycerophosphate/cardiolipin synthase-like enzyme